MHELKSETARQFELRHARKWAKCCGYAWANVQSYSGTCAHSIDTFNGGRRWDLARYTLPQHAKIIDYETLRMRIMCRWPNWTVANASAIGENSMRVVCRLYSSIYGQNTHSNAVIFFFQSPHVVWILVAEWAINAVDVCRSIAHVNPCFIYHRYILCICSVCLSVFVCVCGYVRSLQSTIQ